MFQAVGSFFRHPNVHTMEPPTPGARACRCKSPRHLFGPGWLVIGAPGGWLPPGFLFVDYCEACVKPVLWGTIPISRLILYCNKEATNHQPTPKTMSYTLENITIGDSSFHPENEDEAAALDAAYSRYRQAVKDWDTFVPMILSDHEGQEADAQYDELLNDLATEVPAAAEAKGVHRFSDRLLDAVKDELTTRIPL